MYSSLSIIYQANISNVITLVLEMFEGGSFLLSCS